MLKMISKPLLVSIIAFSGTATPAYAQKNAGNEDIIVSGEGLSQPTKRSDAAVTTIRADDDKRASLRLEQLLTAEASMQTFRRADTRSSHPTANGITMRGLGGNAATRAAVTLDGVPIADPFGGWIAWQAVNPGSLGRIDIMRGGGMVSEGASAMTGLISLSSQTEPNQFNGELSYGSRSSLSGSATHVAALGGSSALLTARYDKGDGFIPIAQGQRGAADRPAPYKSYSARARIIIPTAQGELQAGIGGFHDSRDRGFDFSDSQISGGQANVRYVQNSAWNLEALGWVSLRDFSTNFGSLNDDRSISSQVLAQDTDALGIGGKLMFGPALRNRNQLHIGLDFARMDGTTRELFSFVSGAPTRRRIAGGENQALGLFIEGKYQSSPNFTVFAGTRAEMFRRSKGQIDQYNLSDGSPYEPVLVTGGTDWKLGGRIGFAWLIDSGLTLRGAAYRSFRQPTLNELYRPYRVGTDGIAANPALAQERLTGSEFGLDWKNTNNTLSVSITGYIARLDGAIANVTIIRPVGSFSCSGVGFVRGVCAQRQNLDRVNSKGLEFNAKWQSNGVSAQFSAVYTDAHVQASGTSAALDGLRPAQQPETAIGVSLSWQVLPRLGVWTVSEWQASRFEDDLETESLGSFMRFDLGADFEIVPGVKAGISAENIFNERIQTGVSGGIYERNSPRSLWLSLRFTGV